MADVGEKILNQTPKLIGDLIIGPLSVMKQLAELELANDDISDIRKMDLRKDLEDMNEIEKYASALTTAQEVKFEELKNKYHSIVIPQEEYLSYKEKLESVDVAFTPYNIKGQPLRLLVFDKADSEKVEWAKDAIFKENYYSAEVSEGVLKMNIAKDNGKMVKITGLNSYDIDMFRKTVDKFDFAVVGKKDIAINAKNLEEAQHLIRSNKWLLTGKASGELFRKQIDYDRTMQKELYDNLKSPNGKTIIVCDRDKDLYLKLSDHQYSLHKDGQRIEIQQKNNPNFNSLLMYNALKTIENPVILTEEEFSRDYNKRKKEMDKKEERPSEHLIKRNDKEKLLEFEKEEAYFRHLLLEKKLSMDNGFEDKLSDGVYDALVSYDKFLQNNLTNEEFTEKIEDDARIDDIKSLIDNIEKIPEGSVEEIKEHIGRYNEEIHALKVEEMEIDKLQEAILNEEFEESYDDRFDMTGYHDPDDKNRDEIADEEQEF